MAESAPNANSNFPETAFLVVDTQVFPIRQQMVNIGRNLDNHIVIQEATVSRVHAQIRYEEGSFSIYDLNSTGGTYVNGKPVAKSELHSGDSVMIASVPALFVLNTPQLEKRALAVTGPLDVSAVRDRPTGR